MSTSTGLRVGVVGCGYWGSKHVRVLDSLTSVDQVVVIDAREERRNSLMHSFHDALAFDSLTTALPEVDAVVIATPPTTHVRLALAAIASGKHVLVEKPMATTAADARRLVTAAADAGVRLMVGHTFEHNSAVHKLRELVTQGELGELYNIDTARLNLGLYQSDVNVIFDLAPHDVSIVNHVLGCSPESVQAWATCHANCHMQDMAYLHLFYPQVTLSVNIHVSWLDPCKIRRVTVVGSRKMAVYDDLAVDERIRVYDKGVTPSDEDGDLTKPPVSYRYGDITVPYFEFEEPLLVEDRQFANCIQTGSRPSTDGENGLAVVEVLEALQISLSEGRRVPIAEVAAGGRSSVSSPNQQHESLVGSLL